MNSLEERLRSWVPSSGELDRDRMLFEAGHAAAKGPERARRSLWLWQCATAAALVVSTGLGLAWLRERDQRHALSVALASIEQSRRPNELIVASSEPKSSFTAAEIRLDPSSYLVIMRTMSRDPNAERPLPVQEGDTQRRERQPTSSGVQPLRPRNFDRVMTL
jgi:hypothetical protein